MTLELPFREGVGCRWRGADGTFGSIRALSVRNGRAPRQPI